MRCLMTSSVRAVVLAAGLLCNAWVCVLVAAGHAHAQPAGRVRKPANADTIRANVYAADFKGAKFIWTDDLLLDNTVVFRGTITKPPDGRQRPDFTNLNNTVPDGPPKPDGGRGPGNRPQGNRPPGGGPR
jgi:hypothetical protein